MKAISKLQIICKSVIKPCSWFEGNCFTRRYSQYADYFIRPVYKKETLEELTKDGEIKKLSCMPIKATFNNETCSVFHDEEINLFINYVMRKGQKALAREQVEKSFENIKRIQLGKYHKATSEESRQKIMLNPPDIFHLAMKNSLPVMQLLRIIRGGAAYQVPMPIVHRRAKFIAMNWFIQAAKEKDRNVRFHDQLARELIDAANGTGRVIKKKQELHKQCEANRAYAHYRWGS